MESGAVDPAGVVADTATSSLRGAATRRTWKRAEAEEAEERLWILVETGGVAAAAGSDDAIVATRKETHVVFNVLVAKTGRRLRVEALRRGTVGDVVASATAALGVRGRAVLIVKGAEYPSSHPVSSLVGAEEEVVSALLAAKSQLFTLHRYTSTTGSWWFGRSAVASSICSCSNIDSVVMVVDRPIQLVGLSAYGSGKGDSYTTLVAVLDGKARRSSSGDSEVIAESVCTYTSDDSDPIPLMFEEPVPLEAGAEYTIAIGVYGEHATHGQGGERTMTHEQSGVTFEFSRSPMSSNGTGPTSGQIPVVYFYS